MRAPLFLVLAMTLAAPIAHAQEDTGVLADRLERLERDVSFVQKQIYRGGSAEGGAPVSGGQMQVRFTQIDEELRKIHGQIEQVQFQNKQTADSLKKLSEDIDFRLRAIEQKEAAMAAATSATPTPAEPTAPAHEEAAATAEPAIPATYKPSVPEAKPALTGKDFPDANAHYSFAFKLLNEKKYSEAAASFDAFVKKYPADPLTSNAFYWLGESQYVRNDFTRSADSFRKGFEVNPEGQKAPDNLYKLAMSLSQIKRKSEACVVLAQVVNKYGESAARTAAKAQEARTSLQCK